MARSRKSTEKPAAGKRPIEQYQYETHRRRNNPPVGLVTPDSDREAPKKQYAYDPHLDPTLAWAGKAEHTSFELPTVSLHVHERIDPKTVIEAVRRRNGAPAAVQGSLFESVAENPPLREAIDFYQHAHAWSNRLIAGDSLLVMNSLLEKEGMAGKVQMVYIDPPYGIRYGSNFQPFVNKRDVTLKSIANNEPPGQETLYDQPKVDNDKVRVTGPFTVEAVPAPTVRPVSENGESQPADASVARSGETLRQAEWRAELLKTGIRGKNNQMILFSRVEPLAGTRWLHADAETRLNERGSDRVSEPKPGAARAIVRVVVSFGPEHAPLEQRQVELAWEEARTLNPRPGLIVFAAFQFDPEAAKDIDELTREKTGMMFLKVQMNPDLLTEDLKKKRASNESFWLMGQPDVEVRTITKGEHKGKREVQVHGFDYYNTKTGQIESGDTGRIALWLLDPDYDSRSLFPRQVFFPMADDGGGWARLARNLKAEIDPERIEAYRGTTSLPFEPGPHKRVAVKIVDDRGIESLKIIPLP